MYLNNFKLSFTLVILHTDIISQGVQRNLYGPIWRSRFGPYDIVNVASPELIAQVIQQEGHYPVRVELPHWKEYRDMRGQAYGLHVEWVGFHTVLVSSPALFSLKCGASAFNLNMFT